MSRGEILRQEHSPDVLQKAGIAVIGKTLRHIERKIDQDPQLYLRVLWDEKLGKNLLKIDDVAEEFAREVLRAELGENISIRGEESSLTPLSNEDHLAVLLDMVDGTDLLQRGLENWCSAMVFFDPSHKRVLCALIGTPRKEIYSMKATESGAFVSILGSEPEKFTQRSCSIDKQIARRASRLRDASVAFYGQKAGSFLALSQQVAFVKAITDIEAESKKKKGTKGAPRFRIYNLAGNPMMMHLIEGDIDAIIDCKGQLCHDVVPGFAIALNAGACIIDLDAEPRQQLTLKSIGERLTSPSSRFRYVMATNTTLAREIAALLK